MGRRTESLSLAGPAGALEARLDWPEGAPRGAALVCHPHPQHGGTMHTKAVYRVARALVKAGLVTLRFNFRGVGRSAGSWSGGDGEYEDAALALEEASRRRGGGALVLGGFSFGARIALQLGAEQGGALDGTALLGVAPALLHSDFGFLTGTATPVLLVAGDADPYCPVPALAALQQQLGQHARMTILPGAGHLLLERLDELEETVLQFVLPHLAPGDTPPAPRTPA